LWYESSRWKSQLGKLPNAERDEMLFMLAARWADDIRTLDKAESRLPWHYVDFPFKPEGEPASIQAIEPPQENILTAIAENERILQTGIDPSRRGVALAWLFHLMGDIHQPLHAVQLFSREYPNGDRGGIEMCVRASLNGAPIELHRLWDGVITSSGNINRLKNIASDLLRRFSGSIFRELNYPEPQAWAKESYEQPGNPLLAPWVCRAGSRFHKQSLPQS
jgi:S1/P1 nuclease